MKLCKVPNCRSVAMADKDVCLMHFDTHYLPDSIEKVSVRSCRTCGQEIKPNRAHVCPGLQLKTAIDKQVGGKHYKKHSIQPWHIIDEHQLDFYLGNAIKYVLRDKGAKVEDLEKAIHYLERKIELLKENPQQGQLDLCQES